MGHLLDLRDGPGGQRTGQHDYARTRHSESRGPGMSSPGECAGYDANRGYALGLGDHCVVETPRCTGPSIRDGVNHHVAVVGETLEGLFSTGSAVGELGGIDDFGGAIVVEQNLFQLPQKGVGVVLAVLQ